jgi:hypothetical protein
MLKRCKNFLFALCGFFSIVMYFESCKHVPASVSNWPTVCYDSTIIKIMQNRCVACHSKGIREGREFDANNFVSIKNLVKDGDPWGSKLYTIVSSPNNPNMMPPKGQEPLSKNERTLLEVWILQGANDKCETSINGEITEPE